MRGIFDVPQLALVTRVELVQADRSLGAVRGCAQLLQDLDRLTRVATVQLDALPTTGSSRRLHTFLYPASSALVIGTTVVDFG